MNNNLSLYNIFLAVAEAGSTLGAAKTLFISQPLVKQFPNWRLPLKSVFL